MDTTKNTPLVTFHVYQVLYTGSSGSFQIGPLYSRRRDASLAVKTVTARWKSYEATGQHIFGDLTIIRMDVAGPPPML